MASQGAQYCGYLPYKQALNPQIPGLLVHNEWRGTFEEFEEAVELGELDRFLRLDPGCSTAPAVPKYEVPLSHVPGVPQGPSLNPTPAAPGTGARRDESDDILASILPQGTTITDSEVDALLKELEKPLPRTSRRTYVPSSRVRTQPPPLPVMPGSHRNATADTARYDPGSRNLVEEAARAIGVDPKPRAPVPRMKLNRRPLQQVLEERRTRQAASEPKRMNDELFSSLGLSDVKISEADADAFLEKGIMPDVKPSMASWLGTEKRPETVLEPPSAAEPVPVVPSDAKVPEPAFDATEHEPAGIVEPETNLAADTKPKASEPISASDGCVPKRGSDMANMHDQKAKLETAPMQPERQEDNPGLAGGKTTDQQKEDELDHCMVEHVDKLSLPQEHQTPIFSEVDKNASSVAVHEKTKADAEFTELIDLEQDVGSKDLLSTQEQDSQKSLVGSKLEAKPAGQPMEAARETTETAKDPLAKELVAGPMTEKAAAAVKESLAKDAAVEKPAEESVSKPLGSTAVDGPVIKPADAPGEVFFKEPTVEPTTESTTELVVKEPIAMDPTAEPAVESTAESAAESTSVGDFTAKSSVKVPSAEDPTLEPTSKAPSSEEPFTKVSTADLTAEAPPSEEPKLEDPPTESNDKALTMEKPTADGSAAEPIAEAPSLEKPTSEDPTADLTAEAPPSEEPKLEDPPTESNDKALTMEKPTADGSAAEPIAEAPSLEKSTSEDPTLDPTGALFSDELTAQSPTAEPTDKRTAKVPTNKPITMPAEKSTEKEPLAQEPAAAKPGSEPAAKEPPLMKAPAEELLLKEATTELPTEKPATEEPTQADALPDGSLAPVSAKSPHFSRDALLKVAPSNETSFNKAMQNEPDSFAEKSTDMPAPAKELPTSFEPHEDTETTQPFSPKVARDEAPSLGTEGGGGIGSTACMKANAANGDADERSTQYETVSSEVPGTTYHNARDLDELHRKSPSKMEPAEKELDARPTDASDGVHQSADTLTKENVPTVMEPPAETIKPRVPSASATLGKPPSLKERLAAAMGAPPVSATASHTESESESLTSKAAHIQADIEHQSPDDSARETDAAEADPTKYCRGGRESGLELSFEMGDETRHAGIRDGADANAEAESTSHLPERDTVQNVPEADLLGGAPMEAPAADHGKTIEGGTTEPLAAGRDASESDATVDSDKAQLARADEPEEAQRSASELFGLDSRPDMRRMSDLLSEPYAPLRAENSHERPVNGAAEPVPREADVSVNRNDEPPAAVHEASEGMGDTTLIDKGEAEPAVPADGDTAAVRVAQSNQPLTVQDSDAGSSDVTEDDVADLWVSSSHENSAADLSSACAPRSCDWGWRGGSHDCSSQDVSLERMDGSVDGANDSGSADPTQFGELASSHLASAASDAVPNAVSLAQGDLGVLHAAKTEAAPTDAPTAENVAQMERQSAIQSVPPPLPPRLPATSATTPSRPAATSAVDATPSTPTQVSVNQRMRFTPASTLSPKSPSPHATRRRSPLARAYNQERTVPASLLSRVAPPSPCTGVPPSPAHSPRPRLEPQSAAAHRHLDGVISDAERRRGSGLTTDSSCLDKSPMDVDTAANSGGSGPSEALPGTKDHVPRDEPEIQQAPALPARGTPASNIPALPSRIVPAPPAGGGAPVSTGTSADPRRAVSGMPAVTPDTRRAIPDVRSVSQPTRQSSHRRRLSELMREADEILQEWK